MMQAGSTSQGHGDILKALLRSTLVKDLIRINMNSRHPDSGRNTVKTLMGEDPEVVFGITGSLPVVVNNMTGALTELASQLNRLPPELVKSFMASLADDIDRDAARECGKAWANLASSMMQASPELKALVVQTILAKGPRINANAINAFSRFVNGLTRDDPEVLGRFVSQVTENVDGKELSKAAAAMTNAFLDRKLHLGSWLWKLVRGRMKKKFGI
jgi:hypothetical protein